MATYSDRLSKLGSKLDNIRAKQADLAAQEEAVLAEISGIIGGTAKTQISNTNTPNKPKGKMGDKYLDFLRDQGPTHLNVLANKFKTTPQKVSLSLMHLIKDGLVSRDADSPVYQAVAAKTAPSQDVTDYRPID